MTATFQAVSAVVTVIALLVATVALFFNGVQARNAIRVSQSNTLIHFTSSFFDLLKLGSPADKIPTDPHYAAQFWGLQTTEFYFFENRMLPLFKYTLWMVELASTYRGRNGQQIRDSHNQYLSRYSAFYPEIIDHFQKIQELAKQPDTERRAKSIADFVRSRPRRRFGIMFN